MCVCAFLCVCLLAFVHEYKCVRASMRVCVRVFVLSFSNACVCVFVHAYACAG